MALRSPWVVLVLAVAPTLWLLAQPGVVPLRRVDPSEPVWTSHYLAARGYLYPWLVTEIPPRLEPMPLRSRVLLPNLALLLGAGVLAGAGAWCGLVLGHSLWRRARGRGVVPSTEELQFSLETEADPRDVEFLGRGLSEHARPITGSDGFRPLTILARDRNQALVGGVHGQVNWNWLHVSLLWVAPGLRHRGLGSELLSRIESAARERGCERAHLDTFSYQARPFYERHGYRVFAVLEDYPPGHQRIFLAKRLG